MHADISGDAGEHYFVDAGKPQHEFEIGGAKRALPRLVDDRLALTRRQLLDDLPAGLAAHQNTAAGSGIADTGADLTRAPALVCRQIGEVWSMPLAGMDHMKALEARGREDLFDRFDRRAGEREVVAHLVDIAADTAKVGLHVDNDQRGVLRPQVAIIRPRIRVSGDVALQCRTFLARE